MTTSKFPDQIERQRNLSKRELEILGLIAIGLDNNEIGKLLILSPETIKTHVRRMLEKFSARNRTHMVTLAWELEWLTTRSLEEARYLFLRYRYRLGDERYKKPGER